MSCCCTEGGWNERAEERTRETKLSVSQCCRNGLEGKQRTENLHKENSEEPTKALNKKCPYFVELG